MAKAHITIELAARQIENDWARIGQWLESVNDYLQQYLNRAAEWTLSVSFSPYALTWYKVGVNDGEHKEYADKLRRKCEDCVSAAMYHANAQVQESVFFVYFC